MRKGKGRAGTSEAGAVNGSLGAIRIGYGDDILRALGT
jgi:hypothetical protein